MQNCWNESPKRRCTFKQIVEELNELTGTTSGSSLLLDDPGSTDEYMIPMQTNQRNMVDNHYANVPVQDIRRAAQKSHYMNVTTAL